MDVSAPDGRQAQVMGNPIIFTEARAGGRSFPPALGEDTINVLRTILDMPEAEVTDLLKSGAVIARKHEGQPEAG